MSDQPAAPSLWHHADFMKLWIGQVVSFSGSALTRLAVPLIAAVTLKASPVDMGLLAAAGSAPSLIVGLFAGVVADRYRRRTLLIIGDVGRALLIATIPAAALLGVMSMAQLYIVSFLSGVLTVFFDVAVQSYVPTILDHSQLVEGNSKLGLAASLTSISGTSLAGLIIQLISAPASMLLDALSFLISAGCVLLIRHREPPPEPSSESQLVLMREGVRVVAADPLLRAFAGCLATSNFASNIFFALYILFGTQELGLDAVELGLVYGIGTIGAVISALLAPRIAARIGVGRAVIAGALLGSLEVLPAAFATPALAIPLLLLSSLLGNFGWVLYNINTMSVRQTVTPMALQGRMNATFYFLVAGMLPLGALAGGALGQALGVRSAIALSAGLSQLSGFWLVFSPVRRLIRIPSVGGAQRAAPLR